MMGLMEGMVGVGAAIIIECNSLGHTCLGTRCRSFCPVLPFHHDDRNGIGFLGNTCEIILEGLIGVMTMMGREKEGQEEGNMWEEDSNL